MSPEQSEAVRGIHVWDGAAVVFCEEIDPWLPAARRWHRARVEYVTTEEIGLHVMFVHPIHAGPDLSDPDTCAAYLRRLAIRLGCPESVAALGVSATADGDGHLDVSAAAHLIGVWGVAWSARLDVATDDRILALARAWPR